MWSVTQEAHQLEAIDSPRARSEAFLENRQKWLEIIKVAERSHDHRNLAVPMMEEASEIRLLEGSGTLAVHS